MRKCRYCDSKGEKTIDERFDDFVVIKTKTSRKYYHKKCFYEYVESNKKIKDKNKYISEIEIENEIEKQRIKSRSKLLSFMYDYYDTTIITAYIINKIDDIFYGKRKNFNDVITYEELLLMYKKKGNYLNKIAIQKKNKGMGFKSLQNRISYDLGVLVNMYPSFKAWKKKQELLAKENKNENNKKKEIDFETISNISKKKKNNKKININELF